MRCGGTVITIQEITPYVHCCLARPRTCKTLMMGQRLINHNYMHVSLCDLAQYCACFLSEIILKMVQRNSRATNVVIRKIFISII